MAKPNAQKKTVLVLNQTALPRSAPGATRHVELFGKLDGWKTIVLAGNRSFYDQSIIYNEGILETVRVTRYTGNGPTRIRSWAGYSVAAIWRGIRMGRLDVVYGSSPHLGAALAGLIIAKLKRAHFIVEVRDLWPQILVDSGMMGERSLIYRSLKVLERFLYRQAEVVVVLAVGAIEEIVADGVDREKIHFLPNGANTTDFVVTEDRETLRERYDFTGTVIVYAGAHGPANGLELVLDAAEELTDTDVQFVLIGSGVSKDGLVKDAEARGITNVRFRDPIGKNKIPEIFAAADVGLHCLADVALFHHGVSPNKLYDYMASGLPALTNTPGEVAAMVEAAKAGIAVGPYDIADGMRKLMSLSKEELHAMGESGRVWMEANRSRTALSTELRALLDNIS